MSVVPRRHALALVRPTPVRPGLRLPSARSAAIGAAVLCVLALSYVIARETSIFAVRSVEVRGAPPDVAEAVESAAQRFVGESLLSLDGDALRSRLEALPSVISASYDRAFPSTLRIVVQPERPAAVVRAGTSSWIVSERSRVIGRVPHGHEPALPRVWLPSATVLAAGQTLRREQEALAVRALARLPEEFPLRVTAARERDGRITFVLAGRLELRLGDGERIPLKLAAAASVLGSISPGERASLAYLDVSLPERPVGGENTQVEG